MCVCLSVGVVVWSCVRLVGWFVAVLFGGLAGRIVGLLAGWLAGWLGGWVVG